MNAVIVCALVCLCLITIGTIIRICLLSTEERLQYFRRFKKGRFAIVYLVGIPLFLMCYHYNGLPVDGMIWMTIKSSVELIVFKYDYGSWSKLMNANALFRVTMDLFLTVATLNMCFFAFSLFAKKAINGIRKQRLRARAKNVCVLVGFDKDNIEILKSMDHKDMDFAVLSDDESIADICYLKGAAHYRFGRKDDLAALLSKIFRGYRDRCVDVIISTGDDPLNLIYTEQLQNLILKEDLVDFSIDDKAGLHGYVFGKPENMSAFAFFVEKTNGCIHYVNKYKLIAMDFLERYPITRFMSEKEIDPDTATVNDDLSINVVMIGFGKTNQQIFLTSIANNQLMTMRGGALVEKPITYRIYDRKKSVHDKNLNHKYFRYRKEILETGNKEDYLPLPEMPARDSFAELDINNGAFYDSVRADLEGRVNGVTERQAHCYNYIVVAFGTDMENLDFSQKLTEKIREWGLSEQTKVFVKIRNQSLTKQVIDREVVPTSGIITFGNEASVVYRIDRIIREDTEYMARDRHLCYALEQDGGAEESEALKKALKKWYSMDQTQRESNIYACLSIRMKLNLLGYDYAPASADLSEANDAYMAHYAKDDAIRYAEGKTVRGRKVVAYSIKDINKDTLRGHLAIQEHQRWNAYMICSGIVPSTIAEIEAGDSKNLKMRRHGNITTFDGLVTFRRIMARITGKTEEDTDVIKYDYQLMDDVVWLLGRHGYKIVRKEGFSVRK